MLSEFKIEMLGLGGVLLKSLEVELFQEQRLRISRGFLVINVAGEIILWSAPKVEDGLKVLEIALSFKQEDIFFYNYVQNVFNTFYEISGLFEK